MAVRRVPSQHATIAAAVSAASSGDTILLEDGDHAVTGTIALGTLINIRFVAEHKHRARVVDTTSTNVVLFSATVAADANVLFVGLVFVPRANRSGGAITPTSFGGSFEDCIFDYSGRTVATTSVIHPSTAGNDQWVRRCEFIGPGSGDTSPTVYFVVYGFTTANTLTVESLLIRDVRAPVPTSISATQTLIRCWGSTGNATRVLTRITFSNVRIVRTTATQGSQLITLAGHVTSTHVNTVANVVVDGLNITGTAPTVTQSLIRSAMTSVNDSLEASFISLRHAPGSIQVSQFVSQPSAGPSLSAQANLMVPDNEPMLSATLEPLPGGKAFRNGSGGITHPIEFDVRGNRFHTDGLPTTPGLLPSRGSSRGALEYSGPPRPRLYVHWEPMRFLPGFTLEAVASPDTLRSFVDPRDIAWALKVHFVDALRNMEIHYDWIKGEFFIIRPRPGNLVTSTVTGIAALRWGIAAAANARYLGPFRDLNEVSSEALMDEDLPGDEQHAIHTLTQTGHVVTQPLADGARRWVFGFTFVSNRLDTEASPRGTTVEQVFNQFFAGRKMRVWRNLLNDQPWSYANPEGYSDIAPMDARSSLEYGWFNSTRSRLEVPFSGVSIETTEDP